jgi:hypothetical protein
MHEFRIEKDRCSVTLSLVSGETITGAMFVQHTEEGVPRRESAYDVLNGPERFFPIETADGQTLLIAKDRVVEALTALPANGDELRRASARSAVLDIVLPGGDVRSGTVLLELPLGQPRVLDFLNRLSDRFLVLYAAEGTRLVNRALIERVYPRD